MVLISKVHLDQIVPALGLQLKIKKQHQMVEKVKWLCKLSNKICLKAHIPASVNAVYVDFFL